jgi:hypothetical protein
MLLGDFDMDAFPTVFTKLLFVVFMFIVVVILLNILIAIVSDSYDNAMVKSTELFWKSRLELVAEIKTVFEVVLKWYKPQKVVVLLNDHQSSLTRSFYWLLQGVIEKKESIVEEEEERDDYDSDYDSEDEDDSPKAKKQKLKVEYVWYLPAGNDRWKLAVTILLCIPIGLATSAIFVWRFLITRFLLPIMFELKKRDGKGVDLPEEVSAENGEWAGKVMDIVNRVNEKTVASNNATKNEMMKNFQAMEMKNIHLEAKLDNLMRNLEVLMESQGKKAVKAPKASTVMSLGMFGRKKKK